MDKFVIKKDTDKISSINRTIRMSQSTMISL